jgi:hypothetical protein
MRVYISCHLFRVIINEIHVKMFLKKKLLIGAKHFVSHSSHIIVYDIQKKTRTTFTTIHSTYT